MGSLRARRIALPPDPIALARACEAAGLSRVCLLHSSESPTIGHPNSYVAAEPDAETDALDPFRADPEPLDAGELASAPRWIGAIPFEACRHLERAAYRVPEVRSSPSMVTPRWLRFPAVLRIEPRTGEVFAIGRDPHAVARLVDAARTLAPAPRPIQLGVSEPDPPERHVARVARAIELILDGDLYQVNLARRLALELEGEVLELYRALAHRAPAAFGAALDLGDVHLASTSPELALLGPLRVGNASAERVYTEPIKGTRPRGSDALRDRSEALALDADPKERAELAMIVDVERNDLGRVAQPGSVHIARAPAVVTHRTVHHRKALLTAALRPGVSREELLRAMVPSGSVTGAPKIRAMEVIAALEADRRGLYTGVFGHAAHDGSFTLAMAIRTAVLQGQGSSYRGEYFTGGGIVADSLPERELTETRWKAAQLERTLSK